MSLPRMGPSDEPYDPDMTVQEALDQGLIAVIETGVIGRTYHKPCDEPDPGIVELRCTRVKGHSGVHAYVRRWENRPTTNEDAVTMLEGQLRMLEERARQSGVRITALGDAIKQAAEAAAAIQNAPRSVYGPQYDAMKDALRRIQAATAPKPPAGPDPVFSPRKPNREQRRLSRKDFEMPEDAMDRKQDAIFSRVYGPANGSRKDDVFRDKKGRKGR